MAFRLLRHTSAKSVNVALIGAAGGIGQPLGLLLKGNKNIKRLALFDIAHTPGVAKDLSHISTPATVEGFLGTDLPKAISGADIIIIPAGVPRKPGMTRDDLFNMNASVVYGVAEAVAKHAPKAQVCIITNPVNSTVPIFAEVMKKAGKFDAGRLYGVTTLDLVRARTFVNEAKGIDLDVPVVGGHSGPTIVPLLSQVTGAKWSADELEKLTHRIQYAGDEVVNAKAGAGSATLSMAYAGYRFADALIRAAGGEKVSEYAFVQSNVAEPSLDFFASRVQLGKDGVSKVEGVPKLSKFEEEKYAACVDQLKKDIGKGVSWAQAK